MGTRPPVTDEWVDDEADWQDDAARTPKKLSVPKTVLGETDEAVDHFLKGINPLNLVEAAMHPIDTVKGFGELAKGAGKVGLEYVTGKQYQPGTATSALAEHVYENPGASAGDAAAILFGPKAGELAKLGALKVLPKAAKVLEESRVGNIVRAAAEHTPEGKANIERLVKEGRMYNVPIGNAKKVQETLQGELDQIAPHAAKVENELGNYGVGTNETADALAKRAPGTSWETPETDPLGNVTGFKTHTLAGDDALRRKLGNLSDRIHREGGATMTGPITEAGTVPARNLVELKRELQGMSNYANEDATQYAKLGSSAMDEVLTDSPNIDPDLRQAYKGFNAEQEQRLALVSPLEAARKRSLGEHLMSRPGMMQAGRAGLASLAGYGLGGAHGALAGFAASGIMESTMFNTLSAAAKLRVAEAFKAGGVPAALKAMTIANAADDAVPMIRASQQANPEEE